MLTAYLLMQALSAPPGIDASPVLERVSRLRIPASEIVAFDAATDRAFVTSTDGVVIVKLADGRSAEIVARVDAAKAAGIALGEISHVRVDPRGRGVAACTVIPPRHAEEPGKVLFFESTTGATLAAVDVGFNPDCCEFSADGAFLVVANEGEPEAGTKPDDPMHDPPGSVSRIALDDLAAPADFAKLTNDRVRTVSIPRALIAAAKPPLRIHPSLRRTPELDVEPEFIALDGHTAMVSLQENDAIGAFDCDRSEWVALHGLGTIERTIDASDKDGGAKIDDAVAGLPMPDHVAIVEVAGRRVLVTADEGDHRGALAFDVNGIPTGPPLADRARVADLARAGRLSPALVKRLDLTDAGVGRLRVAAFDGDDDGDGLIDRLVVQGSRDFATWDIDSLARISDTGSGIETTIAARMPDRFNAKAERGARADEMSTASGPEPEGLAVGRAFGRSLVFGAVEEPGALALMEIADDGAIRLLDVVPLATDGDFAPEGVAFVPARAEPPRPALVLVACEASGTLLVFEVRAPARAG